MVQTPLYHLISTGLFKVFAFFDVTVDVLLRTINRCPLKNPCVQCLLLDTVIIRIVMLDKVILRFVTIDTVIVNLLLVDCDSV
jgi:hypothetical protein